MTLEYDIAKTGKVDFETIFNEAQKAAVTSIENTTHQEQFGACGFAWVRIKPATSPFVKWLKKQAEGEKYTKYGRRDEYNGGWTIWNPGQYRGQNVDIKSDAAHAFANVLKKYGIDAWSEDRLD